MTRLRNARAGFRGIGVAVLNVLAGIAVRELVREASSRFDLLGRDERLIPGIDARPATLRCLADAMEDTLLSAIPTCYFGPDGCRIQCETTAGSGHR